MARGAAGQTPRAHEHNHKQKGDKSAVRQRQYSTGKWLPPVVVSSLFLIKVKQRHHSLLFCLLASSQQSEAIVKCKQISCWQRETIS